MRPPSELEATGRALFALAERGATAPTLDAVVLAESAANVARATGSTALELDAERLGARMAYALGDLDRAQARFVRASAAARALGGGLAAARIDTSLAFLSYDRGDAASAREQLDAVTTVLDALPPQIEVERHRALVEGYRGNLARQATDYPTARGHYLAAMERAAASEASVPRATFAMDLAATELASGRKGDATLWLGRASRFVEELPEGPARTLLRPLVAHYDALLALSSGARDAALVDIDGPSILQPIRAWLYDAMGSPLTAALRKRLMRLVQDQVRFEHARFGARLLSGLRGEVASPDTVLVARDGTLIVRAERSTDLSRHEPLRRILEGLAGVHAAGGALDLRPLIALGWPGERMTDTAAKNRAHVALSTLRSSGLNGVLLRTKRGYGLDPRKVRVTR